MPSDPPSGPLRMRILLAGAGARLPSLRDALLELGCEIAGEAADTDAVLRQARQLKPDLVLLDGELPPRGGAGTVQRLMRERPTAVVVMSQVAGAAAVQRALDMGASGYLARPVRPEDLAPALLLAASRFAQFQIYERLAGEMRETNERLLMSGLREQQYAAQFRQVAEAALRINREQSTEGILQTVVEQARDIIGAHLGGICLTADPEKPLVVHSASDRVRPSSAKGLPDPSSSFVLSCRNNRSIRLRQQEIEALDALRTMGGDPLVVRGWLAAPLVSGEGGNIGVLWLTDQYEGELTEEDEAILVQLAQLAALALENQTLYAGIRERDQAKDRFLAMLAHELRNPIAPIVHTVHMLRNPRRAEVDVERALDIVERQAQRLAYLVDELMDTARMTQDRIHLRQEPLHLAQVVRSSVDACQPAIDERAQQLSVELPDEPVPLEGDLARLEQVLSNLLTNAAKFTEHGGRIWLTASRDGDTAVIRVRDNGAGIAPELLPHIFDLFVQDEQGPAQLLGGLGIGLALVRRLVELHDGSVTAHSAGVGRGSEFTVRLPVAAAAAAPKRRDEEADPLEEGARRVLVVEDNPDAADTLEDLLQAWGHATRTVRDGPRAAEAAREYQPDVVLLDLGLPGLDGYEVARRLRRLPELEGVLLVALTGYGDTEDERRAAEAGFDEHLVKPVDPADLRQILQQASPPPTHDGEPNPRD